MINRMVRASKLDVHLYEEVERDISATSEAAKVVLIVAVASGIGAIGRGGGVFSFIFGILAALVGWVIWSAVTYFVGTKLFATKDTRVSLGEMLRTIGFAQSPGVLNVLGIIPVLGAIVTFFVGIWVLIAGIIAIRHAMDFSTGRAIATALVGFLAYVAVAIVLGLIGLAI